MEEKQNEDETATTRCHHRRMEAVCDGYSHSINCVDCGAVLDSGACPEGPGDSVDGEIEIQDDSWAV